MAKHFDEERRVFKFLTELEDGRFLGIRRIDFKKILFFSRRFVYVLLEKLNVLCWMEVLW